MTTLEIRSREAMERLGRAVAARLGPGDVVVLHGALGAGKTTFSRGIGDGLGVVGTVQSPTFVVARSHDRVVPELPALVHVDAYRLSHSEELVDLDIDYDNSIVLIEWGRPFVEKVASEWLDVDIETQQSLSEDDDVLVDDRRRIVTVTAHTRSGDPSMRFHSLLEALNDFGD